MGRYEVEKCLCKLKCIKLFGIILTTENNLKNINLTIEVKPNNRVEEMELKYCKKCNQMTNHKDNICLKCKVE